MSLVRVWLRLVSRWISSEISAAESSWAASVWRASMVAAKAVALLVTNPGDLMDYINAPVGKARAPQHPQPPAPDPHQRTR